MNKLVSVSAKGAKTVTKGFRDTVVADVKAKGLAVGDTVLTATPNGTFAVQVGTCPATDLPVYLVFAKAVVTANDPFALKVKTAPVVDADATPAFTVSL